jgi:hypothetical protein
VGGLAGKPGKRPRAAACLEAEKQKSRNQKAEILPFRIEHLNLTSDL